MQALAPQHSGGGASAMSPGAMVTPSAATAMKTATTAAAIFVVFLTCADAATPEP